MKPSLRKYVYSALVVFCATMACFIFLNGKSKSDFPKLKERQGALAQANEWVTTQANYQKILNTLKNKPEDATAKLQLAKVFMQEARATGDNTYYNEAALEMIGQVLAKDPKHFEGTCLKAMALLSQHQFGEGREVAEQAKAINPYNAFVYGLLCDANVEMGNYATAVEVTDKMVSVRPDIRSYSRISYLREIHGDMKGAIQAIKMAVSAGFPGNEDTAWSRMVLAHLYEDCDSLPQAVEQYELALAERPDYPFALAGLGRVAQFRGDYTTAIQYLKKALGIMADVSFIEHLSELYRLSGDVQQANAQLQITLDALLASQKNTNAGHVSDMELAQIYQQMGQTENALQYAELEYKRRPENIDACTVYAWALYQQQRAGEALPVIQKALKTGSENPERLVKAGLILAANQQMNEGKLLINKGLLLKPYMNADLLAQVKTLN